MNIGFERIDLAPSYAPGVTVASFAGLEWTSKAAIVTAFKTRLKTELRSTQRGLCCYCRRPLPSDPQVTHLEHFIEKAACPHFAFEIRNLALSCATCNSKKNRAFALLCGRLTRRVSKNVANPAEVVRCPVLVSNVAPATITSSADFRWVHPHLDTFSEHITVRKGYVFQKRTIKGHRTIKGLELNSVGRLEHRAAIEKLSLRTGPISIAIGLAAQLQFNSPSQVYMMAADVIRGKIRGAQGR